MADDAGEAPRFTRAAGWAARREGTANRTLIALDGATAAAERPVAAAGRRLGLNPLHHTGPLAVFLFIVACATGVYLTMFFRFGFDASYSAVATLEESIAGRVVRAGHRYSSIALVIVSILHGWRTFVMRRFQKPRRTAWVTGSVMVAVVWLIGVSGYWLIWDQRAQVLNEALRRVLATWTVGLDFMIDWVLTDAAGTGWPFILLLFLVHFLLSVLVAVLIWFHLRHLARPAWLATPFWAGLVGVTLLVASLAFPVGMLPPVDLTQLVGRLNFDPFFLFLLPPAIRWQPGLLWSAAALVATVVVGLPWLVLRRRPGPVEVIAERCIGCTWCAADCPYDALDMTDDPALGRIAVVAPNACVSCGICLGSCPTQALALEGLEPRASWEEMAAMARAGAATALITCQRHFELVPGDRDPAAVVVPCIGMVAPALLEAASDAGLAVELVACPPDDCSFREGSRHLAARLEDTRPPRLRKAYRGVPIAMATPPPGDFYRRPPPPQPPTPRTVAPLLLLIVGVALASVLASQAVFDNGGAQQAAVTISLDHRPGIPLVGEDPASPSRSTGETRLTVTIDDEVRLDRTLGLVSADAPGTALLWQRFLVPPGRHTIEVRVSDEPGVSGRVLYADTVTLEPGRGIVLDYRDQPVETAVDAGRRLFASRAAGCTVCHSLDPGRTLAGPSLSGVADRAASTIAGLDAAAYLRQSIVDPDAYVVPGFPAGQMLPDLADLLSEREIDQLVAFLLTLEADR